MTWLSKLFVPNPTRQIARARRLVEEKEYNEARLELEGIDSEEARELARLATQKLIELNLEQAYRLRNSGEQQAAREALDRARALGATAEQVEAAQRRPVEHGSRPSSRW